VHVEHKAADRHCRTRTIVDQILPIGVAEFGCVLPECAQQILCVARGQTPAVQNRVQAQAFRLVAVAEQARFKTIQPYNFFGAVKLRMIRNVVGNADEFVKCQNDRPVTPLDES
jgi:hypothetical protein